jgi:acid stress-induced BolA-like protein IbaG/YrbA
MQVIEQIQAAIQAVLPSARVNVSPGAGPGHFRLQVVDASFREKSVVEGHRVIYGAITPLMEHNGGPIHAIDELKTAAL